MCRLAPVRALKLLSSFLVRNTAQRRSLRSPGSLARSVVQTGPGALYRRSPTGSSLSVRRPLPRGPAAHLLDGGVVRKAWGFDALERDLVASGSPHDAWPGRGWAWRQSQRESSMMPGQDVDGPGGSPSLRGRMAVRPVIIEDSRGHRCGQTSMRTSAASKIACRRGESNPYVLADRRV